MSARPALTDNGDMVYNIFQQGMGRIWAPDAIYGRLPNGQANYGMDIHADLAHGWDTPEDLAFHYQGKKKFGLHCLRATFATTLAGKGVGTRVIQGLLGHSDPRTVLRYAAYTEKMAIEAVKVLDG